MPNVCYSGFQYHFSWSYTSNHLLVPTPLLTWLILTYIKIKLPELNLATQLIYLNFKGTCSRQWHLKVADSVVSLIPLFSGKFQNPFALIKILKPNKN